MGLALLFLAALLLPSANYVHFDGLPLNRGFEFGALILLLPLFVSPNLRRSFGWLMARVPRAQLYLAILLGLAIALKVALFAEGGFAGWTACYRSTVPGLASPACERSFENPWARFESTRIDDAIDFGAAGWDLSFINSLRFNFYFWEDGNILRDHLPFSASWQGVIAPGRATTIRAVYIGQGSLRVDGRETILPDSYRERASIDVTVPAGQHAVSLDYRFDDGYRTGQPKPPGPRAELRLLDATDGGTVPLRARPPPAPWRLLGLAADVSLGSVLGALAFGYLVVARRSWWWLAPALGSLLILYAMAGPDALAHPFRPTRLYMVVGQLFSPVCRYHYLVAAPACLFAAVVISRRRLPPPLLFVVLIGFACVTQLTFGLRGLTAVVYQRAGDDWLSYQSFARSILETGSLQGGEPVFWLQPLVRYVLFVLHLLLGDGDGLVAAFSSGLLWFAAIWALQRIKPRWDVPLPGLVLYVAAGFATMVLVSLPEVVQLVAFSAAEYPTWVMLPAAWILLFTGRSYWHWSLGAGLLGLAFLSRTDQALGIAATLAVFLLKNRRLWPAAVGATFPVLIVLGSLPLVHNLYYGHRFELLTASHGAALEVPPSAVPRSLYDPNARALVWSHLAWMLDVSVASSPLLMNTIRTLQVIWLVAVALVFLPIPRLLRSLPRLRGGETPFPASPVWIRALMLVPLAYLGVHTVFQVSVYYPRHIVVSYLAMGLAAGVAASRVGRSALGRSATSRSGASTSGSPGRGRSRSPGRSGWRL